MNRILLLLIVPFILFACSSDDNEPTQDYTSFAFYTTEDLVFPNCIVGIQQEDNTYKKIADLGDLKQNIYSKEVKVVNNITDVYLFTDYNNVNRFDAIYKLEKNKKNVFEIVRGTKGIKVTDKTDPTQYPQ